MIGKILLICSAISALYFFLGFGVTYMTRGAVIDQSLLLADDRKLDQLSKRFDWDLLRQNVKDHIRDQKQAVKKLNIGNFGGGPRAEDVDDVVDYFVQPENLVVLMHLKDKHFPNVKSDAFFHGVGFVSPWSWKATFGLPAVKTPAGLSGDKAALFSRMQSSIKVSLVFELDGFAWKATHMNVPLFLVPQKPYSKQPLTDVFKIGEQDDG